MDIKEICTIICMFILAIGCVLFLFVLLLLSFKYEKEFKELRNKELKARIKLFEYLIEKDKLF